MVENAELNVKTAVSLKGESDDAKRDSFARDLAQSKIQAVLDQLKQADPTGKSPDIQALISSLSSMAHAVALGSISGSYANTQLNALIPAIDRSIEQKNTKEMLELAERIQMAITVEEAKYEQMYRSLSASARHRIDEVSEILSKETLTHADKVKVIEHIAVPDMVQDPKLRQEIAEDASKMPSVQADVEVLHKNPKAARKAQIENEVGNKKVKEIIEKLPEEQKADAKMIVATSSPKEAAAAIESSATSGEMKQKANQSINKFVQKSGPYLHDAIKAMPKNERENLPEGKDEKAQLQASFDILRKLNGKDPSTPTEAAAFRLVATVGTAATFHRIAEQAREYEKANGKDIDAVTAKLFDPATSKTERQEILTTQMLSQYKNASPTAEARIKAIAKNTVEEWEEKYSNGKLTDIGQANNKTLNRMSQNVVMDVTSTMQKNLFNFDKQQTDKIAERAGRETEASWKKDGHETIGAVLGGTQTAALKVGAAAKKFFLEDATNAVNFVSGKIDEMRNESIIKDNLSAFAKASVADTRGHKFNPFDMNHSGRVTTDEVESALKKANVNLQDYAGKDGKLDQAEIKKAVTDATKKLQAIEEKEQFADIKKNIGVFVGVKVAGVKGNPFDLNKDGQIGVGEIMNAMKKAGVNLHDYEGGDGRLSAEELKKAMDQAAKNLAKINGGTDHKAEQPHQAPHTPAKAKAAPAHGH